MFEWILAGWLVASVLFVWWHKRLRPRGSGLPQAVEEFLVRMQAVLSRRHPGIRFRGLIPGEFTALLTVSGQDTPVPLNQAFRHAQAFPSAFDEMVDQLVADVQEIGLEDIGDHGFADVAHDILPQIRTRDWLDHNGRFGDSGLVHRMLGDELAVTYVIDDPDCMVFVCRAHLRRWNRSEADLYNLALQNLARVGGGSDEALRGDEPVVLRTGDGYDAARVLLLAREEADGLLVALPDRDVLWVGSRQSDLAELMAANEEVNRSAVHPLSPRLYRIEDGQLQPVTSD